VFILECGELRPFDLTRPCSIFFCAYDRNQAAPLLALESSQHGEKLKALTQPLFVMSEQAEKVRPDGSGLQESTMAELTTSAESGWSSQCTAPHMEQGRL
jgi:hypothetical protein